MKKLYRSEENKVVGGILGGLGEYFEIDPVLLRLAWLVVLISSGVLPGVIVYLIALFIVPKAPKSVVNLNEESKKEG
ncbi:MAG: PspC domain-containing protein [Anaplasmataceae bacterium]|nr:PspC domain-containing protein [Anaplasmataceae bacterium]